MGRPGRRWLALLAALLLTVLAACSDGASDRGDGEGPGGTGSAEMGTALRSVGSDFSGTGPYPVGQMTLTLEVDDRDDRSVLVVYPASGEGDGSTEPVTDDGDPPAVAGDAPFPVVLYSHGLGGTSSVAARQLQHLASWGFVAAAPEHLERNLFAAATGGLDVEERHDVDDLRAVLRLLASESAGSGDASPLVGAVDLSHVGGIGHSAGARAVAWLAQEGELDAWVGQARAPPVPFDAADLTADRSDPATLARLQEALDEEPAPELPALLVAADGDAAVPMEMVEATYDWLAGPKQLVTLARTGHNSFTDVCDTIRAANAAAEALAGPEPGDGGEGEGSSGGVLDLGSDGCTTDHLDPAVVREVVGHLQVAHLRSAFFDTPVGRASTDADFVTDLFPEEISDVQEAAAPGDEGDG